MPTNVHLSKKFKRQAVLWLFEELAEEHKSKFEKVLNQVPSLKEYTKELRQTLKLVDQLPLKYPTENTTKKNRILVSGRIDNYMNSSSASKKLEIYRQTTNEIIKTRRAWIITFSSGFLILIASYFYFIPPETPIINQRSNSPPAIQILSKQQQIQNMIDNQALEVSKIRILKDNTNRITFTIEATQEIFFVGMPEDKIVKNILYFVVRHGNNPGTRLTALKVLSNGNNDDILKELAINILLSEENPGIRLRAIRILENYTLDNDMKDVCIKVLLEDDNNVMRMEALSMLSTLTQEDLIPVYQVVSRYEQNEFIREEAARLLIRIQSQEDSPTT